MDMDPKTVKDAGNNASEYSDSTTKKKNRKGVMMANLAEKICYNCGEKGRISTGYPARNKKNETTVPMNAGQLDEGTHTALALPNAPRSP